MEEIYVNLKHDNPTHATNRTGKKEVAETGKSRGVLTVAHFIRFSILFIFPFFSGQRSSKSSLYLVIILSLSLLSVFLLAGLITLGFLLSHRLSSMTEERDLLQANLTEKTEELEGLHFFFNQNKKCPAGWTRFNHSFYLLSESSGSWDAAVKDCRDRGTYLVVIDFPEEQNFLSTITIEEAWIGLNDKEQEGTWKWVDGTPLSLTYWADAQPDDGGGKEDCVHVRKDKKKSWNDLSCSTSLKWICEKTPNHCTVS
ncbi:CD209 antigen-like protein E isoform X1 [Simochromis diagramma]|uniref:CD209 antigen-like protein E isoform X1 n=1 Tax=Simochromis diagramma TaxID=43689 RepID=UPI001A7EA75F|nr:CD209 antigen-like protein E isoform X1 [Simochromis diagramma]